MRPISLPFSFSLSFSLSLSLLLAACGGPQVDANGNFEPDPGLDSPWGTTSSAWGSRIYELSFRNDVDTGQCPEPSDVSALSIYVTFTGGSDVVVQRFDGTTSQPLMSGAISERHADRVQPTLNAIELYEEPDPSCDESEWIVCSADGECLQNGAILECDPPTFELDGIYARAHRCAVGPRVDPDAVDAFVSTLIDE